MPNVDEPKADAMLAQTPKLVVVLKEFEYKNPNKERATLYTFCCRILIKNLPPDELEFRIANGFVKYFNPITDSYPEKIRDIFGD